MLSQFLLLRVAVAVVAGVAAAHLARPHQPRPETFRAALFGIRRGSLVPASLLACLRLLLPCRPASLPLTLRGNLGPPEASVESHEHATSNRLELCAPGGATVRIMALLFLSKQDSLPE